MWMSSYTVTPHTYILTLPGSMGLNSSSFPLRLLKILKAIMPPRSAESAISY